MTLTRFTGSYYETRQKVNCSSSRSNEYARGASLCESFEGASSDRNTRFLSLVFNGILNVNMY